ncbi:hypothetical protein CEUSTIGMA_g9051.t1 [Chlamydomonas eustigma]|uniref:Zinc-finger domain-containing protein n=1 Tax=Chlamydomonas eustigma TaxID=1157962 RepID=A0A250XEY6_9CHLO|nr:hypothetical protein CEUSTIGMA_g9051.t1 [Chlamydomonas eustigma]|eukprot:GAX81623.1 hypothetical protein CEUSTIGMA_g9051.t1 [Chlamydomonas eustigma]
MSVPNRSASLLVPAVAASVNDYERAREARIAANLRMIKNIGVLDAAQRLAADVLPQKERKPRVIKQKTSKCNSDAASEGDVRRSSRDVKRVVYLEDAYFKEVLKGCPGMHRGGSGREARELDEEEVAALRSRNGVTGAQEDEDLTASQREAIRRGPVDSGKGVRIQGGKVYDSKFGVTCHWCRQKTLEDHVTCSSEMCGKGKRLPTTFCKNCLRNRHGEDAAVAAASGCWECPQCRGSCGRGCVSCCNCGPCRKKAGLEPTRQIVHSAKDAGFNNVHDYLVHLVTGESSATIAARKTKHTWGAWLSMIPAAPSAPLQTDVVIENEAASNHEERCDLKLNCGEMQLDENEAGERRDLKEDDGSPSDVAGSSDEAIPKQAGQEALVLSSAAEISDRWRGAEKQLVESKDGEAGCCQQLIKKRSLMRECGNYHAAAGKVAKRRSRGIHGGSLTDGVDSVDAAQGAALVVEEHAILLGESLADNTVTGKLFCEQAAEATQDIKDFSLPSPSQPQLSRKQRALRRLGLLV